jgi:hypothetical protein
MSDEESGAQEPERLRRHWFPTVENLNIMAIADG